MDALQTRFLRDRGISEKEALMSFGLAPLCVRRDIAMLGLIHRSVLGKGPNHFSTFFVRAAKSTLRTRLQRSRHSKQLIDTRDTLHLEVARRSALGLVSVYNLLPQECVDAHCVSEFQGFLQRMVKHRVSRADWLDTLSPRIPMHCHPLCS